MSAEPERLREAREKRKGRGKLSSIEMLPEDAASDVAWARDQLRDDKLPQTVILNEFNARLAARGLGPISKGAWSRYSVRKAIQFRELDETRRIAGELVTQLGTDGPDELTMMVAEMIKVAAFQRLERGDVDTKGLQEVSRALGGAVNAQKTSAEHRRKLEEVRARVDKAIDAAGAELADDPQAGADPAAVLKKIREDVYGIFER